MGHHNFLTKLVLFLFFKEIMKFMHDYPLAKNQKEVDCIYFLLQALHHHSELCDEIYCQLMKQTTSNKSTKHDSCAKGWRLLTIICTYFKASDRLKPYLFKYLESHTYDLKRPYNSIAQIALTSLRKTYKYGGRRNVPNQIELDALIIGRISKRQMFLLPGGVPILLNIRSYTVVNDCIENICHHLGVDNQLEHCEFAIYYVVEAEKAARPLNRGEYIFDIITELTKLNNEFYLIFKRVLWFFPLRYEPDSYIDMMYNQILPDYIEGLMITSDKNEQCLSDHHLNNDLALLSALQFKANDKTNANTNILPTIRDIKYLLPINVVNLKDLKPHQWMTLIHSKFESIQQLTTIQAKMKFLEILQTWPLVGSTFFYVKNVYDSRIHGDCILAINKLGVNFLHKQTHVNFNILIQTNFITTKYLNFFLFIKK
jgi:myosin XV